MSVDYRKPGAFTMIGGFNITNNDPVDSRAYVADINHIYDDANWVDVKPYPGLIVSAPDGQVRICINSDYTLESSWKEIGGSSTDTATNYAEALELAQNGDVEVGQLIYVLNSTTNEDGETTYASGLYVVTATGESAVLSKVGTTSASGNVEDDVQKLQTDVAGLSNRVTTVETKLNTVEEGAQVNVIETIQVNGEALTVTDKTVNIEIPEVTYDTITYGEDGISATTQTASPSTASTLTVLNKLREDISAIPQFKIAVVDTANEDGTPQVAGGISTSTIYLLSNADTSTNQLYTEWIYVGDAWEKLGEATIDLAPYAKTEDVTTAIEAAKTEINTALESLATKSDLNAAIARIDSLEGSSITGITLNGVDVEIVDNVAAITIESISDETIDALI